MATLFGNVKNKMKRDKMVRQLSFLAIDCMKTVGFGTLPEKDAQELVAAEPTLAMINPTVAKDVNGQVQVAATPAGVAAIQALQSAPAATPADSAVDESASFEILTGIALPSIKRGGGQRESKYPFGKLEVGQAFDVQATPKSFNSTLAGQNRKFAKENPPRKFTLRTIKAGVDLAKFDGVRVFRIPYVAPTPKTAKTPAS